MMRQGRRGASLITFLTIGMMAIALVPHVARGASQFDSPAFAQQWNSVEAVTPNFWGPLATARAGQTEPYAGGTYNGQPGGRLVQYFDKARMEQTTPDRPVTNGLLTVELKSGNLQLGDVSFEQHTPAAIGIAGDQDVPGPTYATLNDPSLPERVAPQSGAVDRGYDVPSKTFVTVPPATDPQLAFVTYQGDPGGRFGQNIPKAFWDFMQRIPGPGWLTTMGYPISPAFGTQVPVNGVPNTFVVVQAFERRVLTYTPSNPDAFKVEFGNIGRHYDTWRYEQNPAPTTSLLSGGFGTLYNSDERVRGLLGGPQGVAFQAEGTMLEFERGRMFSFRTPDSGAGSIYILSGDPQVGQVITTSRGVLAFDNPWRPGEPVGGGPGPTPGLYEPRDGFGKLWRQQGVRDLLGYAIAPEETSYPITVQRFVHGVMLSTPDGRAIYVLTVEQAQGRYERFPVPTP